MSKRRRGGYPWWGLATVPPDPRRKTPHLVCYGQRSRYAPLEVFCAAGCIEQGKARPEDNGCRHSDVFLSSIKPWYRARARVIGQQAVPPDGGRSPGGTRTRALPPAWRPICR